MLTPVQALLKTARAEIGYLEKKTNSQLDDKTVNAGYNNWTKYARDLDLVGIYNGKKNGYAWCFTAGTMILTSNGYKSIEDIEVGDLVLNATGDKFNTVTNIVAHPAKVINVSVYGAIPFRVTKDHPFLSKKRVSKHHRKKGFRQFQFNEIGDLNKKDVIAVPETPNINNVDLTYDEIWVLGYYVGDGFKNRKDFVICGNDNKMNIVREHIDIIPEKNEYKSRTCQQAYIPTKDHPELMIQLEDCGNGALHKKIPTAILYGTNEQKKAFIAGYIAADGFTVNNRLGFSTVSKELATGMSRILMDLGYGCSIVTTHRPPIGQIFDTRIGEIRKFNQQEIIYVCYINTNNNSMHRLSFKEDNVTFVPITNKSTEEYEDIVYTITTDGDHTYTANNLAVHNCDMFVDWCFMMTFGLSDALRLTCQKMGGVGAGCTGSANYYKSQGKFHKSNPQPGDQIFFTEDGGRNMYHTGIVEKVSGGRVYTIEGNTSSAAGVVPNGGAVRDKSYSLSYSQIGGYGRPDYSIIKNFEEEDDDMAKMTEGEFLQMFINMRKSLQDNDASNYSDEARDWAVKSGLIAGNGTTAADGTPNYMWEDLLSREQFVTVLYRFAKEHGMA